MRETSRIQSRISNALNMEIGLRHSSTRSRRRRLLSRLETPCRQRFPVEEGTNLAWLDGKVEPFTYVFLVNDMPRRGFDSANEIIFTNTLPLRFFFSFASQCDDEDPQPRTCLDQTLSQIRNLLPAHLQLLPLSLHLPSANRRRRHGQLPL